MKIMTKEDYLSVIKKFREIQITKICKQVGVDYSNTILGRSSKEAYDKVVNELFKEINDLCIYFEELYWERERNK